MSPKLAVYFLSQSGHSRVLDIAHQPLHGSVRGWTVGRMATCDIAFSPARNPDYAMVSKRHAVIYAAPSYDTTEGGTELYDWTITDCGDKGIGSTNGTYLQQVGREPYRLQPGVPYQVKEGDRVQFGCKAASAKLSFDVDETIGPDSNDDPPTGSKSPSAVAKPETTAEATGRTLADVVVVVLNGPPGVDSRLWWALLALGAVAYVYWVKN